MCLDISGRLINITSSYLIHVTVLKKGERRRHHEGLPGGLENWRSSKISIVCLQVSNSHGLRCILPLLLGLVAISGLGALITCLASRFTLMTRLVVTLAMITRLAFHNKAAALDHLHSLLLTASLLLFGLAILQVLTVLTIRQPYSQHQLRMHNLLFSSDLKSK